MFVLPFHGPAEPEEVACSLAGTPGLVWLDGEAEGARGYSFVAAEPVEVRRRPFGDEEWLEALRGIEGDPDEPKEGAPLSPGQIPRWIGYVAYDAAWSGRTRTAPRLEGREGATVLWFGRYEAVVAFDHGSGERWLVGDDEGACRRLLARIEGADAGVDAGARVEIEEPLAESAEGHGEAIEAALEHIAEGDIYQVNLARRWRGAYRGPALPLFRAMRRASPVPLGMFLDVDGFALLARTMETFLRWNRRQRALLTRPIKGTIARSGRDDVGEARALREDPKEHAEHVMIVDLMRNDLGRVAETGSVEVRDALSVEPYAGLSHLVSTVSCRPREGTTLEEIFEATFPPGSVTGAPKVRAMEVIEELERSPRGVYCGCVGFVDRAGGASFAVAIRTATVEAGEVRYHAGGGLVAASVAAREIAETELKARVFLDALAEARREEDD